MSKKAVPLIITLLLTNLIVLSSVLWVSAEEASSSLPVLDAVPELPSVEGVPDVSAKNAVPSSVPQVSKSAVPVLTVNAISNYFGSARAEYNEFAKEVRVSYLLKSSKRLLSTSWTMSYDSEVLTVDPAKNAVATVCPIMQQNAMVDFGEEGMVHFNATGLGMFDYSGYVSVFAEIVFDVKPLNVKEPENTTVDLSVEDLWISEPNPANGQSMTGKEVVLVARSDVQKNEKTDDVLVSKVTSLTPSTFNERDYRPATADQVVTTVATTVQTTAPPVTVTEVRPQTKKDAPAKREAWVQTGRWYMATLILLVLLACSIVLFVMRKRDIYNS